MTERFATEQERFWAGEFGDDYSMRNAGERLVANNAALFAKALATCVGVRSVLEFGANIGLNLRAIRSLLPGVALDAVEINDQAVRQLRACEGLGEVFHESLLEFRPTRTWDIVLIKGVLIHIDPDHLPRVYDALLAASSRYVLLAEYYNPTPVELGYRGHAGKLFKRDFAGELLDRHPSLQLKDYGFVWRRDPAFPQDDLTWFLLEKR